MEFAEYDDESFFYGKRHNFSSLDFNQNQMEEFLQKLFPDEEEELYRGEVRALSFCQNQLVAVPSLVPRFENLHSLDLSANRLTTLDESLVRLENLVSLIAKNNALDDNSLPKDFGSMHRLAELNLSGNQFKTFPPQIIELTNLRFLYVGANHISSVPGTVRHLQSLEMLHLGGNLLTEVPAEVGCLEKLEALIICENKLESLPSSIAHLKNLRSLALHRNCLTTLPPEIVTLRGLIELSLRDNPLVGRFVRDMMYNPPTLMELSARCIKIRNLAFTPEDLPPYLIHYLSNAQSCVNPKCKGVYFDTCVEHIKFVDFCGKYRIPLLQYLCSPKCRTSPAVYNSDSDLSEDDAEIPASKLKKVLLG